ncbi:predicted protein [Scheffersomyces stipitis CBS 6054]|uniref:Securin n=1 Tax=Scheffersomyces stipitis (strain ATCC 58785 / CBS 6054 / NBRC 10063 / NRRL Y-11545) TaxID=322104 RepID=A3LZF7_PICST|nr:predicted protein [Scheffersomyces stipitis CBS 6054]ABN68328.1 predicted protein [Scheffersomyces stipitis CBS 6054]
MVSSKKSNVNRRRIPLGSKDQNQQIPSLNRAKTSLNTSAKHEATAPVRKAIGPKKLPVLTKANSSLGFIHRKNEHIEVSKSRPPTTKITPQLNSDLFENSSGHSSSNIVTDSLLKKSILPKDPVVDLNSTLSSATAQLHASNIINRDINANNVDPVKKTTMKTKFEDRIELPEGIEDVEVETIADRPLPLESYPVDMVPFDDVDLEFFSKPSRTVVTDENRIVYPEVVEAEKELKSMAIGDLQLEFDYENNDDDGEEMDITTVGLSIDDMKDLLD